MPSNSLGFGLWTVCGAIALYLLGFVALYVDGIVLKSNVLTGFPEPVDKFLTAIYAPFVWLLLRLGIIPPL
jgi:hypothetical protein